MSSKENGIRWFLPTVVFVGVLVVWGASFFYLKEMPNRGTFGDMFGAVNALFSGLAFGGVIYAILLQRKELQLQRNELQLTRVELQGQKEQMESQNVTLKKQNFEATFFQLLRLHNDITNDIDLVDQNGKLTKGRDCFRVFYDRFRRSWGKEKMEHIGNTELERINKKYLSFYENHQSEIGHYFRSLYNIIKLIDSSEIEDKRLYTNLVRAQLSSYELALLFYNSLSNMGNGKFKPLIEKYALLKTLPVTELMDKDNHFGLYDIKAYGE